jgi:hypothetical protein
MLDSHRLPNNLRRRLEEELEFNESIRWLEQPIPRFFTRSSSGICLALLISLIMFSLIALQQFKQSQNTGIPLLEMVGFVGIIVACFTIIVLLILLILVPLITWVEARRSVYVITDQRALILVAGATTTVHSFVAPELRVISRREYRDGSGDVIVYIHKSKDYDGDIQTQEFGFKQIRQPRAFEQMLRRLNSD